MKNKNTFQHTFRSGFTLMEMLSVVFIIGILTAVALPQYRRAMQKSQATEAMQMLRVINDSGERLAATMGYRTFQALATADPGSASFQRMDMFDESSMACTVGTDTLTCANFTYYLNPEGTYISAFKSGGAFAGTEIRLYRGDVPSIKCVEAESGACDLFNLDREAE